MLSDLVAAAGRSGTGDPAFGALLDALPAPVSFYDPDLLYRFANRAYGDWFGHPPADLIGRPLPDILGPDTFHRLEPRIQAALAGRPMTYDARLNDAEGIARWVRIHHVPHFDASGAVEGVLSLIIDVSAEKDTASAHAAARQEADWINDNKTRFLIGLGQDLSRELDGILGFSEMFVSEVFGPLSPPDAADDDAPGGAGGAGGYVAAARDLHAAALRLKELAERVSTLGTLEHQSIALSEARFHLRDAFSGALRQVRVRAREGRVEIGIDLPPSLPRLFADERLIRTMLGNLLTNALDHTPPGGRIKIAARLDQAGNMVLSVSDTGVGIPPQALDRVTVAFAAFSDDGGGGRRSGLGLPLARRFAELHDGHLDLTSTEGRGTTVSVTLPRARLVL
ncbi:ATP-binding protein [Roseospirillum parvum]|nr:ATP-binding protein [Roseospirillum parvum]